MINKLYAIRDVLISKRYYIIGFIALIFIGTIIWLSLNCEDSTQDFDIQKNTEEEVINKCSIDIKGYVLNPNFYEIECDSRVNDAIILAGGLLDNSDTSVINLSKKIQDGMVIVVYSKEEVEKFIEIKKEEMVKEEKCKNSSVVKNDACITKNDRVDSDNNIANPVESNEANLSVQKEENTSKIININTASKEELMTLKGIGESKALAIIQYREEHGLFNSIEDIKKIKGIGEKMFDKIKDFITF